MSRLAAAFTPEEIQQIADIFGKPQGPTAEQMAILRAPFPPELISKRPTIYCRECRNAPGKICKNHGKVRCNGCGQTMTSAHMHLDYVGHADVTNRLLDADPGWNWVPLSCDSRGLPQFEEDGGLWIKLTVCGKTVICYGAPQPGKKGPDAIKETIGDAIRNGAMRLGVALGLWGGKFGEYLDADPDTIDAIPTDMEPLAAQATVTQRRRIIELWTALGYVGSANLNTRLRVGGHFIGRTLEDEGDLTCEEAGILIRALEARLQVKKATDAKATADAAKAKAEADTAGAGA